MWRFHLSIIGSMLFALLLIAAVAIGFVCHARRHFSRLVPAHRVDEQHGRLQIRRYPSLPLAEVRVSGNSVLALKTGTQLLNRYFREEQIARFALPLLAEKVDAADSIWTMAVVLPMSVADAPKPRNKAIQLREQPPQRVIAQRHRACAHAQRSARRGRDIVVERALLQRHVRSAAALGNCDGAALCRLVA